MGSASICAAPESEAVVDCRRGDGGVTRGDADLVQVHRHVAGDIEAIHRGLLVRVDFQLAVVARPRPRRGQLAAVTRPSAG